METAVNTSTSSFSRIGFVAAAMLGCAVWFNPPAIQKVREAAAR